MNSRFTPQIVKIATIGVFIVFALCIYPVSRAHPWSDDWTYPGIYGSNWKEFFQWVVAQHVDHRIPIIKLVQYGLLKASRFDFRVLLLFNAAIATVGALALAGAARLHRGAAHWGDLVIPLTVLNFGFGLYAWAFSAQFSFCIALSFVFLFLFMKSQSANSGPLLIAAMVALWACALCGMNGAIVATVISAAILVLAIRQKAWNTQRAMIAGPASVLATTAAVFLTWQPSGTTLAAQTDPATRMLSWARHLVESSFIVDGWLQGYWRPILCAVFFGAALVRVLAYLMQALRRGNADMAKVALHATLLAYAMLFVSIVLGRSRSGEWSPGLEMHYGYLVVALVPLSWIIVTESGKKTLARWALAAVLVVAYGHAFRWGALYRLHDVRDNNAQYSNATLAIGSQEAPESLAKRKIASYFFVDTPDTQGTVAQGIAKLRQVGGPLYKTPPAASN
ncbi:hypothetical protein [Variovorax paradoxus]|uniref:hypothetical protein n=1 Tax=Variovorax paradoxus TaxID=34073 RepID=UPI0012D45DF0|nr:hypothetical protein [Variovorax paradoxus]